MSSLDNIVMEFISPIHELVFKDRGPKGDTGPNEVTEETATSFSGYLFAAGGLLSSVEEIPSNTVQHLERIPNWDTAYGWGNHANAGYLTSESDPVFTGSPAFGIVSEDIVNWNTAYGWGDHADAGYLTSGNNSDDLPEGTEHLYNQISDVDPSMHADRTDMGYTQGSNPSGYYKDLLSNKKLLHVVIGRNDTEENGAVGFEDGRPFYYKDGREQDVLIGIDIQESVNSSINYFPFESDLTFRIHSGDSVETGLNGVPLVQGYINASMGAYPPDEVLFGGTF